MPAGDVDEQWPVLNCEQPIQATPWIPVHEPDLDDAGNWSFSA
jgi:hypothetical protein